MSTYYHWGESDICLMYPPFELAPEPLLPNALCTPVSIMQKAYFCFKTSACCALLMVKSTPQALFIVHARPMLVCSTISSSIRHRIIVMEICLPSQ